MYQQGCVTPSGPVIPHHPTSGVQFNRTLKQTVLGACPLLSERYPPPEPFVLAASISRAKTEKVINSNHHGKPHDPLSPLTSRAHHRSRVLKPGGISTRVPRAECFDILSPVKTQAHVRYLYLTVVHEV